MFDNSQSTDYSSEFDLDDFDTKEISSTQDTSVLSITQRNKTIKSGNKYMRRLDVEDEANEEEDVQLNEQKHLENSKLHSNKEELIKWAAKLELESLSLKELVKGDMRSLLDQNHQFVVNSYNESSKKLKAIEKRIAAIAESLKRKEAISNKKIQDCITKTVDHKLSSELLLVSDRSVEQSLKQMCNKIDSIYKTMEKTRKDHEIMAKSISKLDHNITNHFKNIRLDPNSMDSHFSNLHQGLADIKQYLKLLLPRLITMEKSFLRLSSLYTDITNTLKLTTGEETAVQPHAEPKRNNDDLVKRSKIKRSKMA